MAERRVVALQKLHRLKALVHFKLTIFVSLLANAFSQMNKVMESRHEIQHATKQTHNLSGGWLVRP